MSAAASITVRVPLSIRCRPGRKTVVTPAQSDVSAMTTRADPALVKALVRTFRYQRLLYEGRYASISEMAVVAERIERGFLGTLLRLTLLAPDVVGAILDGRQPDGISLSATMEAFPLAWAEQTRHCTPLSLSRPTGRQSRGSEDTLMLTDRAQ